MAIFAFPDSPLYVAVVVMHKPIYIFINAIGNHMRKYGAFNVASSTDFTDHKPLFANFGSGSQ